MKKEIGISIYPHSSKMEDDKKYIDTASSLGYTVLFTSALPAILMKDSKECLEKVSTICKYAKSKGMYTVVDVSMPILYKLGFAESLLGLLNIFTLKGAEDMGFDCLRLDVAPTALDIALMTRNSPNVNIQLNMSMNDNFLVNLSDHSPLYDNLEGAFNFYPCPDTGLGYDYFLECCKKFRAYPIKTTAFIGSHEGTHNVGITEKEQPTLELTRYGSVSEQAKLLFLSGGIDVVVFGNAYASKAELEELAYMNKTIFKFKLENVPKLTDSEKEVIVNFVHMRRADLTPKFVRSSLSRLKYSKNVIEPNNLKKVYKKGDVVLINDNQPAYKAEVHIILEDGYEDKDQKYNYIGSISEYELPLLQFIKGSVPFEFEV